MLDSGVQSHAHLAQAESALQFELEVLKSHDDILIARCARPPRRYAQVVHAPDLGHVCAFKHTVTQIAQVHTGVAKRTNKRSNSRAHALKHRHTEVVRTLHHALVLTDVHEAARRVGGLHMSPHEGEVHDGRLDLQVLERRQTQVLTHTALLS